jgi:hypothetical protein
MNQPILVPVSVGELFDKQTILQIKRERIQDAAKLVHVERELGLLSSQVDAFLASCSQRAEILQLAQQLHTVNSALWDLENEVRAFDRAACFDDRFVAAARKIYAGNDRRASIKLAINTHAGSDIVEVKSHSQ